MGLPDYGQWTTELFIFTLKYKEKLYGILEGTVLKQMVHMYFYYFIEMFQIVKYFYACTLQFLFDNYNYLFFLNENSDFVFTIQNYRYTKIKWCREDFANK